MFNYSVVKNVSSRAYIALVGGKVFQVTVNWYKPQEATYLPTFEKAIASLKMK